MEACARADRPGDAFFLYAVAGTSARFDSLRVADRTAHQAQQIVLMRHHDVVPAPQWDRVSEIMRAVIGDPAEFATFCTRVRAAGPPTYYPSYMIQHGLGGSTPIVEGFDAAASWETAITQYLHCSAAAAR